MKKILSLVLFIILILFTGCASNIKTYTLYFDEVFSVVPYITFQSDSTYYANNKDDILRNVNLILYELNEKFDVNKESSMISLVNTNAGIKEVECDEEFVSVLNWAIDISKNVSSKYDPTIYPLFEKWDFTSRYYNRTNKEYNINEIMNDTIFDGIKDLLDYNLIQINNTSVYLSKIGAKIDLGSIVKGYAADKVYNFLVQYGIKNGIINIGGNIIIIGAHIKNNTNDYWNVGITEPFTDSYCMYVKVNDDSTFVTSGIYERYIKGTDGLMYHHILDPKTGYPIDNSLSSVTVFGHLKSMDADALSTSLFTLGLDDGLKYANENYLCAIFITKDKKIYLSNYCKNYECVINEESDYKLGELNE